MPDSAPAAPAAPATPATPAAPAAPVEAAPAPVTDSPDNTALIGEGERGAAPAPPPQYVNPDGTFLPDWTQKLPEDLADSRTTLARYKNVADLAKAYRHAQHLVSQKGVLLPTAESTPEQISEFRKTMGVPEKPEEYGEAVKPDIKVPEGIRWDDGVAQEYFKLAHRLNIPASSMKELVQLNLVQKQAEMASQQGMVAEQRQQGIMQLRQQWGANFDRNLGIARKAAALSGVDIEDPGFSSPGVVAAFVRLAQQLDEGKLVGPGSSLPAGTADAAAQAKDIQTNKENQYYKRYWEGDKDIQDMVRKLHQKAASGGR